MGKASPLKNKSSNTGNSNSPLVTKAYMTPLFSPTALKKPLSPLQDGKKYISFWKHDPLIVSILLVFQSLGTLSPYSQVRGRACRAGLDRSSAVTKIFLAVAVCSSVRTMTAWIWSKGAAPVQVILTRQHIAAKACHQSSLDLLNIMATLVSKKWYFLVLMVF